jgi:hypothetical protein
MRVVEEKVKGQAGSSYGKAPEVMVKVWISYLVMEGHERR